MAVWVQICAGHIAAHIPMAGGFGGVGTLGHSTVLCHIAAGRLASSRSGMHLHFSVWTLSKNAPKNRAASSWPRPCTILTCARTRSVTPRLARAPQEEEGKRQVGERKRKHRARKRRGNEERAGERRAGGCVQRGRARKARVWGWGGREGTAARALCTVHGRVLWSVVQYRVL
eukprot:3164366-Rhodomonas_salina.1